ncbi:unnamed protein product [Scytosiphon promiscuus]
MSEGAPAVLSAGENNAAEGADLARGAAGNVGVAGTAPADPATAPAPAPAGVAALSTNGDAPTTAAAAPVAVSSGTPENGHRPGAAAENGQATEVAPASEPASTASRKRKAGEEVPKTPAAEPAAATPAPGKTTLLAGVRVEDLAPPVRARMEDVLREGEDDGMRKDVRLINFLGEVEEAQALAALNEYHAAVSETSVTIRNKPAYLMGILRKYKQGQRAPLGNGVGGGMATAPNAMGRMGAGPDGLSPSIAKRLQKLYDSGFIEKADVDQRCMVFFRDLTEPEAEAAMDEFGQSDITSIRNKSAFLMSILRRRHSTRIDRKSSRGPAAGASAAVQKRDGVARTPARRAAFFGSIGGSSGRSSLVSADVTSKCFAAPRGGHDAPDESPTSPAMQQQTLRRLLRGCLRPRTAVVVQRVRPTDGDLHPPAHAYVPTRVQRDAAGEYTAAARSAGHDGFLPSGRNRRQVSQIPP